MERKKIVICASASFEDEIIKWKNKLEEKGFLILKYPTKINDDLLTGYKREFSEHYSHISKADILLALNFEKKGIPGYIGAGVFAEIAFALGLNFAFDKRIEVYYLNPIDREALPYSDELGLWHDLGWIKQFELEM